METGTPPLQEIAEHTYRLEPHGDMRVPGIVYASAEILEAASGDRALEQVANVATLPGIVGASVAMPDIHWGYGFPIGGVAAMDAADGVVSPGGVGFDINCGVRMVTTGLDEAEVPPAPRGVVARDHAQGAARHQRAWFAVPEADRA